MTYLSVFYSTFYTLHTDKCYIHLKSVSDHDLHSAFLHLFDFQSKLSEMIRPFIGMGNNNLPSRTTDQFCCEVMQPSRTLHTDIVPMQCRCACILILYPVIC